MTREVLAPHRLAILLGLSALAVTQPVLEAFGASPETLVIYQADRWVVLGFCLVIALAPALVLWLLEVAARGVDARVGAVAELVSVGLLLAAFGAASIGLAADVSVGPRLVIAVVIGVIGAIAVRRVAAIRSWSSVLAAAQVAFIAVFLLSSGGGSLVRGSATALAEGEVGNPAPVVVIILDELPTATMLGADGEIDAESFPGFGRLAEISTWYRNHTTVAPNTNQAVPAILTGQLPTADDDAPVASDHPDNLFTLLGASYDVQGFEQITRMCPTNVCAVRRTASRSRSLTSLIGLARSTYSRILQRGPDDPPADAVVVKPPYDTEAPARFDQFTASLTAGPATLQVLHTLFPHGPYLYDSEGNRYDAPQIPRSMFDQAWLDDASGQLGWQRHFEQTQLADAKIGGVLDRLEQLGTLDDALIIVTADHGIAFSGGEPQRGVSAKNQSQLLWTPLFVKYPGQSRGDVDDRDARSVDVLPTIADVLEIRLPHDVDGRSLLADGSARDAPVVSDWDRSVIHPADGFLLEFDGAAGFADLLSRDPTNAGASGDDRPYAFGPSAAALLGHSVTELDVSEPAGFVGVIEERFADLTWNDDEWPPLYVSGHLPVPPSGPVALAVNDRIVSVVPTTIYAGFEQTAWWSLLPVESLSTGANDLELFLIEDDAGSPSLRPVPLEPGSP